MGLKLLGEAERSSDVPLLDSKALGTQSHKMHEVFDRGRTFEETNCFWVRAKDQRLYMSSFIARA